LVGWWVERMADCSVGCLGIDLVELKAVLLVGRWAYVMVGNWVLH
jgi:hypothetical protein